MVKDIYMVPIRGGRFAIRFDGRIDSNRFESIRGTESKLTEFRFGRGKGRILPSSEFRKLFWFRFPWADYIVNVSQNWNEIEAITLNRGDSTVQRHRRQRRRRLVPSAYRLLGVTIDSWLSTDSHVNETVRGCNYTCRLCVTVVRRSHVKVAIQSSAH